MGLFGPCRWSLYSKDLISITLIFYLQIKYAKDSSEQQRTHQKYREFVRSNYHQEAQPVTVNYSGEYATVIPLGRGQVAYDPAGTYGGGYSTMDYQKVAKGRGIVTRFNPIARPMQIGGGMIGGVSGMQEIGVVIFAYNIGPNATDADLYGLFSKYGRITKVDIIQGKGYGFVHMPMLYEADQAVKALNGAFYNGKILQVSIKSK